MPDPNAGGEPVRGAGAPPSAGHSAGGVDVERLAEKVYRLLVAETRLSLARGQIPRRRLPMVVWR
jgi:hypothetical protein